MEKLIDDLEKLIKVANIGTQCINDNKRLNHWKLSVGDFIQIQKTKDVEGIIYNEHWENRIYVVLGIINGNIHVRGINNNHWGYLHIEHVIKYRKLKADDLMKLINNQSK